MYITMLKSKIHRAMVTHSNLNYEGSITIDESLMYLAKILPFEKVDIYNITNGNRFSTYAVEGKKDSGVICLNGAAAHKVIVGDLIIIASYIMVDVNDIINLKPVVVKVSKENNFESVVTLV